MFDRDGNRLGAKPRGLVHRDKDWHWLVFVWAARMDDNGQARFLMQLRGRDSDPHQGHLDAFAGGHVGADEGHLEGALRECREEAGLSLNGDELVFLGERPLYDPGGVCRKVFQHFYLCIRPILLTDAAFSSEVVGFVEVDLDEFWDLLEEHRDQIEAEARIAGEADGSTSIQVTREYLSAYSEGILDEFRRSVRAIKYYLSTHSVDADIWR